MVTGASAYAGFHTAAVLSKAGHHVRGLTRDTGSRRASQMLVNEVRPVEGDLGKPETYQEHLQDCEIVVHSMLDPEDPQGTDEKLFRAMTEVTESDVALYKRLLVYTTGCSIYSKSPERIMDETTPANPSMSVTATHTGTPGGKEAGRSSPSRRVPSPEPSIERLKASEFMLEAALSVFEKTVALPFR